MEIERKNDRTTETTGILEKTRKLACLKWNKGIGKSKSYDKKSIEQPILLSSSTLSMVGTYRKFDHFHA